MEELKLKRKTVRVVDLIDVLGEVEAEKVLTVLLARKGESKRRVTRVQYENSIQVVETGKVPVGINPGNYMPAIREWFAEPAHARCRNSFIRWAKQKATSMEYTKYALKKRAS